MSLDMFGIREQTVRRLRVVFIVLIATAVIGLGLLLLLDWLDVFNRDHPLVFALVAVLVVAGVLEFGLESLRQAGRHKDSWWRP